MLDEDRPNPILRGYLDRFALRFRYAPIAEYDDDEWHQVVERILVDEFVRKFGSLPAANRCYPPLRESFHNAYIVQQPFDVIDTL